MSTVAGLGVTVTEATGRVLSLTVTLTVPLALSDVAVIVAGPTATPVTRPVEDTVATVACELDQANEEPFLGLAVAVGCTVWPTSTVVLTGWTETDRTLS